MIPIISYGTRAKHAQSIRRLSRSCQDLGNYPCHLKILPDDMFPEDRLKYLYKPTFIRITLERLQTPVIWMDADSYLTGIPSFEGVDFDDFDFGYVKSPPGSHKWFADSCHVHTLSNIPFLGQWEAFCLEEKGISDHTQLIRTFEHMKGKIEAWDVSDRFKGCFIRNYKTYDTIHY